MIAMRIARALPKPACSRLASTQRPSNQHGSAQMTACLQQDAAPQVFRQDRITTDGELMSSASPAPWPARPPTPLSQSPPSSITTPSSPAAAQPSVSPAAASAAALPRAVAGLSPAAPVVPPATDAELAQLVDVITGSGRVLALTGAGCSTESNIPDYRGPRGAYSTGFTPMTHQKFMSGAHHRARYWARSFAGWAEFSGTKPNAAHGAMAALQSRGWLGPIVSQNVDRLHQKGGSHMGAVLELHGTTHEVVCMGCGRLSCRHEFQEQLAGLNPEAAAAAQRLAESHASQGAEQQYRRGLRAPGIDEDAAQAKGIVRGPNGSAQVPVRRPDGDVELQDAGQGFVVPPCQQCGGVLKPHVVFFGDGIPKPRANRALELAESCDALLVVGSSVQVYSAYRLVRAAKAAGARVAILTAGETRADDLADVRVGALAGEVMSRLARHSSLAIPRLQRWEP